MGLEQGLSRDQRRAYGLIALVDGIAGGENWCVVGEVGPETPVIAEFVVGMWSGPMEPECMTYSLGDGPDPEGEAQLRERVAHLALPDRVKRGQTGDDRGLRAKNEVVCRRNEMPIVVLLFGRNGDTNDELAVIYTIPGISAETGLREMQEVARLTRAQSN